MGTGNLTLKVESELINAVAICKSCGKTRTTGEICDTYPDDYIKTRLKDMIFIEKPCECGCNLFDIDAVVKIKLK